MIKEEINLPIYRAKRVDNGEYVEGCGVDGNLLIQCTHFDSYYNEHIASVVEIDTTTLAIHFSNMLAKDSSRNLLIKQKDLRIFASINKNGKGGDLCTYISGHIRYDTPDCVAKYLEGEITFINLHTGKYIGVLSEEWSGNFKILGISE